MMGERARDLAVALVAVSMLALAVPVAGARTHMSGRSGGSMGASGSTRVKMVDDKFKPKSVTVSAGTKVKWTNKGSSPHTTTGSGWDETLSPGQSYGRKFKKAGTYKYKCSFHPKMVGKVVVTS